jgi:Xaa-Pro aminopeptidase
LWQSYGIVLVASENNLVDTVWAGERPARPARAINVLPIEFAGETATSKLSRVRDEMTKKRAAVLVLSALDEIACNQLCSRVTRARGDCA